MIRSANLRISDAERLTQTLEPGRSDVTNKIKNTQIKIQTVTVTEKQKLEAANA